MDSIKAGRIHLKAGYFLHANRELSPAFWKHSIPIAGNELAWSCGFTMYSVIMGHTGSDAVAANSIANIAKNLLVCLWARITNSNIILAGNKLDTGKLALAREYRRKLCQISILSGTATDLILILFSPLIFRYVTLSGQAKEYLKWMLVVCSYYIVGKFINITLNLDEIVKLPAVY